jgi:hypothetical protein
MTTQQRKMERDIRALLIRLKCEIGDALKKASQKFGEAYLDWEELEQDETSEA